MKAKTIIKIVGVTLSVAGGVLNIAQGLISDKQQEITIAEKVAEYIGNGMSFKKGA